MSWKLRLTTFRVNFKQEQKQRLCPDRGSERHSSDETSRKTGIKHTQKRIQTGTNLSPKIHRLRVCTTSSERQKEVIEPLCLTYTAVYTVM